MGDLHRGGPCLYEIYLELVCAVHGVEHKWLRFWLLILLRLQPSVYDSENPGSTQLIAQVGTLRMPPN